MVCKHYLGKRHKGFTLIELLVVLVLMGLLSAIVMPSIEGTLSSFTRQDELRQVKLFVKQLSLRAFEARESMHLRVDGAQLLHQVDGIWVELKQLQALSLVPAEITAYPSGELSVQEITYLINSDEITFRVNGVVSW